MKKDLGVIFGLFAIIVVLLIFGKGFISTSFLSTGVESTSQAKKNNFVDVSINELRIEAEIVNTPASRNKGLSGRNSLRINSGLFFIFEKSANYTFWMKDMMFPIDIIWIDENKRIVHISENASPEPGKKDRELTRYFPPKPVKYVLEINAGISKLHNLQAGDLVNFTLN